MVCAYMRVLSVDGMPLPAPPSSQQAMALPVDPGLRCFLSEEADCAVTADDAAECCSPVARRRGSSLQEELWSPVTWDGDLPLAWSPLTPCRDGGVPTPQRQEELAGGVDGTDVHSEPAQLPLVPRRWKSGVLPLVQESSSDEPSDAEAVQVPQPLRKRLRGKQPVQEAAPAPEVPAVNPGDGEQAVEHGLRVYRSLKKTFKKRNHWVAHWIRSRPEGFFHKDSTYQSKRDQGFRAWSALSQEEAESCLEQWLRADASPLPGRGAPLGNNNASVAPPKEVRCSAAIVNWNVEPCEDPQFQLLLRRVQQANPEGLEYEDLMDDIRALPVVRRSWAELLFFVAKLKEVSWYVEESSCMELSLHGESPRWHFHLVMSNLKTQQTNLKEGVVCLDKPELEKLAPHPCVHACKASNIIEGTRVCPQDRHGTTAHPQRHVGATRGCMAKGSLSVA